MKITPQTIELIMDAVTSGASLGDALKSQGVSQRQFSRALEEDFSIREALTSARQIAADEMVDDARRIVDDPTIDPHRARNMADMRKWIASKRYPRVYGDRIDVTVTERVDLTKVLADADARALLLSPRDPAIPAEYQVLDITNESSASASGSQPVDSTISNVSKVKAHDLLK